MNSRASLLGSATLFELSPHHVDEGERIGFLHDDKAAALGRLMAVDGQRDPIKVVAQPGNPDRPWRLVTGMHRLIGARIEALTIHAIDVTGKPEDLADLEASENLHRRPLGPIERAKFVHALCEAAQVRIAREHGELKQHQLGGKARWAKVRAGEIRADQALQEEADGAADKLSAAYSWQESAADAFGLDPRSIRRALRLYRLLVEPFPDLIEQLAAHPVVGDTESQLKQIADIADERQRRQLIETLLADPELSVEGAKAALGLGVGAGAAATPVAHQKFFNQITSGWSRLGLPQKRAFIPELAGMLSTPDLKRAMRDRLNEELGDAG